MLGGLPFIFLSDDETTRSGWTGFLDFAYAYSQLPDTVTDRFGSHFLTIQKPGKGGA